MCAPHPKSEASVVTIGSGGGVGNRTPEGQMSADLPSVEEGPDEVHHRNMLVDGMYTGPEGRQEVELEASSKGSRTG